MTFLFPRLDRGIIISYFEKIAFFDSGAILGVFSSPRRPFFAARAFLKIPLIFAKKKKNEKFFADFLEILLSYPGVFFRRPRTISTFFFTRGHVSMTILDLKVIFGRSKSFFSFSFTFFSIILPVKPPKDFFAFFMHFFGQKWREQIKSFYWDFYLQTGSQAVKSIT